MFQRYYIKNSPSSWHEHDQRDTGGERVKLCNSDRCRFHAFSETLETCTQSSDFPKAERPFKCHAKQITGGLKDFNSF